MPKITIAIEGCCHGELDKIYGTLQLLEQREGKKIDLLLICGDFQAVRNLDDLETLACPPKYRGMHTFYKYYSGEKVAPIPTIFVGGNHEAANHLWELYYGGWAAPNIYFLGFAGAVRFGGLRIAGLSGIYKSHDYTRGHHESLPYTESTIRSIYHVRDFEVYRLLQLLQPTDIFLSHDWPTNIARHGNTRQLLARKPHFRNEVESGTLGGPPLAELLSTLRPAYWFAAHMHIKFAALVEHGAGPPASAGVAAGARGALQGGAAGAAGASGRDDAAGGGVGAASGASVGVGGFPATRFLALDKCLPGRDFLQVLELDAPGPPELHYDEEWLAVLRSTHHLINLKFQHTPLPGMGHLRTGPRPEDLEFVRQALAAHGGSRIPDNFAPTAESYDPSQAQRKGRMPQRHVRSPQTVALLEMLGLPYNLDHKDLREWQQQGQQQQGPPRPPAPGAEAGPAHGAPRAGGRAPLSLAPPQARPLPSSAAAVPAVVAPNPEEIDLDEDDQEQGGAGGAAGAPSLADDPMFQPMNL